jgi:hypothetical protein
MYFYTPTLDAVILAHKPGLNYPLNWEEFEINVNDKNWGKNAF